MRALFAPILAGATLRDRLFACAGALFGILVTGVIGTLVLGSAALPWLAAPMGAAAVLVFAAPASPLAQPWPVIGGNTLSALTGVLAARLIPDPHLAAAVAVAAAILVMSLTRSLHPPGGASALSAVIGGEAVRAAGFGFALLPIGLNAVVLALCGVLFHRLSGHSYPHRPAPAPGPPIAEDIDRALAETGESFDISHEDLEALFARAARHAAERRKSIDRRKRLL
ncbi:HPP family protein [Sphingomonas sp. ID0503]|uniref:HPP family protein n=1 Tax=Sphingomonas sp. ID0503 TaxID=3399691 RepID=UPI003AFA25FD